MYRAVVVYGFFDLLAELTYAATSDCRYYPGIQLNTQRIQRQR